MTRPTHIPLVLLACLAGAACRSGQPSDTAPHVGGCSVAEPGAPPTRGSAIYDEQYAQTPAGVRAGSRAVTITCSVTGLVPEVVVLMLPNLARGTTVAAGRYRVQDPRDTALTPEQRVDPSVAWARVTRGSASGELVFAGEGGEVVIGRGPGGVIEGAYQVAIVEDGGGLAAAGAPVDGTTAKHAAPPPSALARSVVAGGFIAPRAEGSLRGR